MRLRDLQQILGKFTDGNKGTAISDCFIYMETDNGNLAEVGRIELQESRLINFLSCFKTTRQAAELLILPINLLSCNSILPTSASWPLSVSM